MKRKLKSISSSTEAKTSKTTSKRRSKNHQSPHEEFSAVTPNPMPTALNLLDDAQQREPVQIPQYDEGFVLNTSEAAQEPKEQIKPPSSVTRGPGRLGRRERNYSDSHESLRFLMGLGILPITLNDDAHFYAELASFVRLAKRKSLRATQMKDPWEDLLVGKSSLLSLPTASDDFLNTAVREKFQKSLATHQEIAAIARTAMFSACEKLFGPAIEHESTFNNNYDVAGWLQGMEVRNLLFKSKTAVERIVGGEKIQDSMRSWNFKKRAHFGIDVMCALYAGMLAVFRRKWCSPSAMKKVEKYAYHDVHRKVTHAAMLGGNPGWSTSWIRVLLFGLPADSKLSVDEEDGVLFKVGLNLEHLGLQVLQGVLHDAAEECRSRKGVTYPWTKKCNWQMPPVYKRVGEETIPSSRYKENVEIIKASRMLLVENASKVYMDTLPVDNMQAVDAIIQRIITRANTVNIDEVPARQTQKPSVATYLDAENPYIVAHAEQCMAAATEIDDIEALQ